MQVQMTIPQKSFMQGGLGEITSVIKDIFNQSGSWVVENWNRLPQLMNADLVDPENTLQNDYNDILTEVEENLDIMAIIGQSDRLFFDHMDVIRSEMSHYIKTNVIGHEFYR